MPQVIAIACPQGYLLNTSVAITEARKNRPRFDTDQIGEVFASIRDITDDLPAGIIGECVTEATLRAWRAGNDPAKGPFRVYVFYR